MNVMGSTFQFDSRDIRLQSAALATVLAALTLALTSRSITHAVGLPYGSDFSHFYVLGQLAARHDATGLFDQTTLDRLTAPFTDRTYTYTFPPLYGPVVALVFAPLAALPYKVAALLWAATSLIIYIWSVRTAWRSSPHLAAERSTVLLAALAFPALWRQMLYLQTTVLLLLAITLAWMALRQTAHVTAGLALGLLALKPQHALVFGAVLLLAGSGRVVAGMVLSLAAQLGVAALWFGPQVLVGYAGALKALGTANIQAIEPDTANLYSWMGAFRALLPPPADRLLWLVVAAAVVWVGVRIWRSKAPLTARFGLLIVATIVAGPHVMPYDLVLLAPALVWLVDWARPQTARRRFMYVTTYLCFVVVLVPLATWLIVQPLVVLLTGVLVAGYRWTRADSFASRAALDNRGGGRARQESSGT